MNKIINIIRLALTAVAATVLTANGDTLVSDLTHDYYPYDHANPTVGMGANGNFVITWKAVGIMEGEFVAAKLYDNAGQPILDNVFRVSETFENDINNHSAAMDANGNFVIAWYHHIGWGDLPPDSDTYYGGDIFARRYDSSGNPLGGEFIINKFRHGNQSWSSLAMTPNGFYVISWWSDDSNPEGIGIYARLFDNNDNPIERFDSSGNSLGSGEFKINTSNLTGTGGYFNSAAMDTNGNFVITWKGSNSNIYAQRFNSSGNPVGLEFLVNTDLDNYISPPDVTMDANGNFVFAWKDWESGSPGQIVARLYDNSGNPVERFDSNGNSLGSGEFRVNTTNLTENFTQVPSTAMTANGNFVVTWIGSDRNIYAQKFNSSGNPVGPEFPVNINLVNSNGAPEVAMDTNGNFVIAWTRFNDAYEPPENNSDIYMNLYLNTPAGEDVVVKPVDPAPAVGDGTEITITFDYISTSGETTVTSSDTGTTLLEGFKLGTPPVYYNLETTAVFTGEIHICIDYSDISYDEENNLRFYHYTGSVWKDVTDPEYPDMVNNIICGTVNSFSEFAMLEAAFHFVGFLSPLENPPVVNSVKAGQSVPLKFQLIDDNGGYLSNLDAVTGIWLQQVECTNSQLNNDVYTTNTSGDSGLHYDTETNQFIYTWKTKKNIPDCSRIILELYNSFLQEVYFEKK